MAIFGMFNIAMLVIGLFEIIVLGGFIVGCIIVFIVGICLRKKFLIIASLVAPILLFGSLTILSSVQKADDPFPSQIEPPHEQLIPGTYVLDPDSFEYLKSRGFEDLSATIILYPNHTFKVTRMPHIWTDGSPESKGYDQCFGSWGIGKDPNNEHCYYAVLQGDKNIFPMGAVFLYFSSPKGKRHDYALRMPIFYGDFDYIYFVKQGL